MITKVHRLLRIHKFEEIFREGKRAMTPFFVVYIRENGLSISRFSIVVSLKISKKAVERNRIKRRIRAFLHTTIPTIKKGSDVIIRVNSSVVALLPYRDVERELIQVLKKAQLI